MREAGIDIYIPRKPHPYGLLNYVGCMKLCYSHLPIVVDCQPRLPQSKKTAKEALISIARRVQLHAIKPMLVIADSGFPAKKQFSEKSALDSEL
jgi:hypothetical protein